MREKNTSCFYDTGLVIKKIMTIIRQIVLILNSRQPFFLRFLGEGPAWAGLPLACNRVLHQSRIGGVPEAGQGDDWAGGRVFLNNPLTGRGEGEVPPSD